MVRNELPGGSEGGQSFPPVSPLLKGIGVLMAVGVVGATCHNVRLHEASKPFDTSEAFKYLPPPKPDMIRAAVEKDAARCMAGTYESDDLLRGELGKVIDLTNTSVSATCKPSPNDSTAGHTYTFQTGPENCSNTLTTLDGKQFTSAHFYGNCPSLPGAL